MRRLFRVLIPLAVATLLLWPRNDSQLPRLSTTPRNPVDPQPVTDPDDSQHIHLYERNEGRDPSRFDFDHFPLLISSVPSIGRWKVSAKRIEKYLTDARREREQRLRSFGRVPNQPSILPRSGGAARVWVVHMTLSDRIEPPVWGGPDPVHVIDFRQLNLIRQVARIGRHEGFAVTVRVDHGSVLSLTALQRESGINLIEYEGPEDLWSEDSARIAVDHSVSVPGSIGDHEFIIKSVLTGRLRRLNVKEFPSIQGGSSFLKKLIAESYPAANYEILGRVDQLPSKSAAAAIAISDGTALHEDITYVEGGDVLGGVLPGKGRFAIVGRDSVAVSKALLERDLGHPVNEHEVLEAIAADFGVEHVFPIEPPGEFHLDMASLLVGPSQVILNDAEEAARLEEDWLHADFAKIPDESKEAQEKLEETIRHIWEKAHWRMMAEDRALADLRAAGVTVYRAAGIFHDGPIRMNLLNSFVAIGSKGDVFAVVFGADPRAEAYFARKLLLEIPSRLQRIYFLSRDVSVPSGTGGIKCRVSLEGELETSLAAAH